MGETPVLLLFFASSFAPLRLRGRIFGGWEDKRSRDINEDPDH